MDAAWAVPLNTALLIALAYLQYRTSRKAEDAKRQAKDARQAVGANRRNHRVNDNGRRRRWTDSEPHEHLEEH